MKGVVAKFILRLLHPEQKEHHATVADDLIQTATSEPGFLKKVVTGDESWVCGCDPQMKARSSQWKLPGSPRPKNVLQGHGKLKTMLTVVYDWEGAVHHEYNPPGQTLIRGTTSMFFAGERCNTTKMAAAMGSWRLAASS